MKLEIRYTPEDILALVKSDIEKEGYEMIEELTIKDWDSDDIIVEIKPKSKSKKVCDPPTFPIHQSE